MIEFNDIGLLLAAAVAIFTGSILGVSFHMWEMHAEKKRQMKK
jgi:hypothetical protein